MPPSQPEAVSCQAGLVVDKHVFTQVWLSDRLLKAQQWDGTALLLISCTCVNLEQNVGDGKETLGIKQGNTEENYPQPLTSPFISQTKMSNAVRGGR